MFDPPWNLPRKEAPHVLRLPFVPIFTYFRSARSEGTVLPRRMIRLIALSSSVGHRIIRKESAWWNIGISGRKRGRSGFIFSHPIFQYSIISRALRVSPSSLYILLPVASSVDETNLFSLSMFSRPRASTSPAAVDADGTHSNDPATLISKCRAKKIKNIISSNISRLYVAPRRPTGLGPMDRIGELTPCQIFDLRMGGLDEGN